MRQLLLTALLASALHGAVVRGVVVENQTDRALSRASILLEPVPGSPGTRMTVHSDRFGLFEFAGVKPGTYMLLASRLPFLTAMYGQKRWNSAGRPLVVVEQEMPFLTIRMLRYGSIAGTVMDENGIGVPLIDVVAYLIGKPPQVAARATSDEQGRYRVYGLLPGTYTVRSAGKRVEDVGYVPTYTKEAEQIDQSRVVDVEMEQQVNEVNIRPVQGKLFTFTAIAMAVDPGGNPVSMTFAGEMSRQIIRGGEIVSRDFPDLPAGDYELYGEAPRKPETGIQAEYQRLSVGKDGSASITLRKMEPVRVGFGGVQPDSRNPIKVAIRHKDLAGTYDTRTITTNSILLPAGIWEFALVPLQGYYATSFSGGSGMPFRRPVSAEGWNEAQVVSGPEGRYRNSMSFSLSKSVSTLHGLVKDRGDPVVGASVFAEPIDLEPAKRTTPCYVVLTGIDGQYKFDGLAPGNYRLLATFDYQMPDTKTMQVARAKEVRLEPRADSTRDLDLYIVE